MKDSLAYDFIKKMPKKLNTKLGENALKIWTKTKNFTDKSTFKWSIIILDEATNQLDYNSSKIIKIQLKN